MQEQGQRSGNAIRVQSRFFALYRERVGQNTLDIDLPQGATVGDLVAEVHRLFPAFSPNPAAVVVAVNREYAPHDHPLREGDEAAFIPPVSGGQGQGAALDPHWGKGG